MKIYWKPQAEECHSEDRERSDSFENNKEVSIDARIASVILELECISLKEDSMKKMFSLFSHHVF